MRFRMTLLACFTTVAVAGATSLWREDAASPFADHRARKPGDLVTVLIVENSSGSNSQSSATSKEAKSGLSGGPGVGGLFKWLTAFSADHHTKNEFSGNGKNDISTQLNARLTCRVVKVDDSGNLVIEGTRTVAVNKDEEDIVITATVRAEDVRADNTVLSTFLADAHIASRGHGPNASAQRHGLISRVLDWIF